MPNNFSYDTSSNFGNKASITNIYIGEVIRNDDPSDMGRIKVKINGLDKSVEKNNTDELPWCFPMIPKYLGIIPQLKESVMIFMFGSESKFENRLYIGPIISQPQNLNFDPYHFSALAGFTFGAQEPGISPSRLPKLKGVYANKNHIVLQGRENTDIIFKDNELLLRAGKFIKESDKDLNITFNTINPAFIQIRNDVNITNKNNKNNKPEKITVTNIVSNKINLLTHKDGSPRFNLSDQDMQITDEELAKILETAHQLGFGDIQLEYLKLLKDAFLNHVHNGSGSNPTDLTGSGNKLSVETFKNKADALEAQMLSKNIRIN